MCAHILRVFAEITDSVYVRDAFVYNILLVDSPYSEGRLGSWN